MRRRVECPLCGGRFRKFAPSRWDGARWSGDPVRCPACGSLPRHRFLWLYLEETDLGLDVLHISPEHSVGDRLQAVSRGYVSLDLEPGRAMVEADLTRLPFDDASFDLVLCSHVLEHVPDDRAAMREMARVLRHGGLALIQTPVNRDQAVTYEDVHEADPETRLRRFSQADHVRVYGIDFEERLRDAGFDVTVADAAELGADAVRRHGLAAPAGPLRNELFACRRAG